MNSDLRPTAAGLVKAEDAVQPIPRAVGSYCLGNVAIVLLPMPISSSQIVSILPAIIKRANSGAEPGKEERP